MKILGKDIRIKVIQTSKGMKYDKFKIVHPQKWIQLLFFLGLIAILQFYGSYHPQILINSLKSSILAEA